MSQNDAKSRSHFLTSAFFTPFGLELTSTKLWLHSAHLAQSATVALPRKNTAPIYKKNAGDHDTRDRRQLLNANS